MSDMRHLVGVMLAIVLAAAVFFAASWGYLKLLIGPAGLGLLPGGGGSLLHSHPALEGFGAQQAPVPRARAPTDQEAGRGPVAGWDGAAAAGGPNGPGPPPPPEGSWGPRRIRLIPPPRQWYGWCGMAASLSCWSMSTRIA